MTEFAGTGFGSDARRHATLKRTRRFAVVGAVVAAVALLVGTAVTFTAENGNDTFTITSSAAAAGSVSLRTVDTVADLATQGTAPNTWKISGATTGAAPAWTPVLNNAVSVTTPGDIAIIDARGLTSGNILITLSLTNAAQIDADHNYFILPVDLWVWQTDTVWAAANTGNGDSLPLTGGTPIATQYLSTSNGYLTWTVDGTGVYEITIPTGGSIFAVSTLVNSSHALAPTFVISTTPA